MFKKIDKNLLKSFSFFFTHVPKDVKIENLLGILADGFKLLPELEKEDENLVELFRDIVEKAEAAAY
jgi:hypothetical protein